MNLLTIKHYEIYLKTDRALKNRLKRHVLQTEPKPRFVQVEGNQRLVNHQAIRRYLTAQMLRVMTFGQERTIIKSCCQNVTLFSTNKKGCWPLCWKRNLALLLPLSTDSQKKLSSWQFCIQNTQSADVIVPSIVKIERYSCFLKFI